MSSKQKILAFEESDASQQQKSPSWLNRLKGGPGQATAGGPPQAAQGAENGTQPGTRGSEPEIDVSNIDRTIEDLRAEALEHARRDAELGIPEPDSNAMTTSEVEMREKCRSIFERWRSHERETLEREWADEEREHRHHVEQVAVVHLVAVQDGGDHQQADVGQRGPHHPLRRAVGATVTGHDRPQGHDHDPQRRQRPDDDERRGDDDVGRSPVDGGHPLVEVRARGNQVDALGVVEDPRHPVAQQRVVIGQDGADHARRLEDLISAA